jgi:hypothetical protein
LTDEMIDALAYAYLQGLTRGERQHFDGPELD